MENTKVDYVKKIYSDLRAEIISGKIKSGVHLVETKIAAQYQTSRLHVKSAFRLLEAEHLVEYIKMRGFVVLGISTESIEEIIEIRQALESVVVKKVIKTATDEDIEKLKRIANRIVVFTTNNMMDDVMDELDNFYQTLYTLCKYYRITSILNTYSDYIILIRNLSASSLEHHKYSAQNFFQLVDAIEKRDTERALQLIEERHKYLVLNK